jgi:hypothetical protein
MTSFDTEERLDIWVVYDHPRDFPDNIVARRNIVLRTGIILKATNDAGDAGFKRFLTLDEARAWLSAKGLTKIPRAPDDDPVILESWI